MSLCWKTIDYVGGGFVLQRQINSDEEAVVEHYDEELDRWMRGRPYGNTPNNIRVKERIIHVTETEIDISEMMERGDLE